MVITPTPQLGISGALNVQVHTSCEFLTIRAKSFLTPAGTELIITITHYDTGASISQDIYFTGSGGYGVITVSIIDLPSQYGLYKVCLSEAEEEQICKPVLIACDIDCCLTDLVNELLACACDCPKCASTLAKAQKIFLLLQSALSAVDLANTMEGSVNMGYYIDILKKYKKAVELCDSSCGCDC